MPDVARRRHVAQARNLDRASGLQAPRGWWSLLSGRLICSPCSDRLHADLCLLASHTRACYRLLVLFACLLVTRSRAPSRSSLAYHAIAGCMYAATRLLQNLLYRTERWWTGGQEGRVSSFTCWRWVQVSSGQTRGARLHPNRLAAAHLRRNEQVCSVSLQSECLGRRSTIANLAWGYEQATWSLVGGEWRLTIFTCATLYPSGIKFDDLKMCNICKLNSRE